MTTSTSTRMAEAIELLDSVQGKPQLLEERKAMAVQLAALMLEEASRSQTPDEKGVQRQLSRLMQDPVGKAFTTAMTDECFRSSSNRRVAERLVHLLHQFGIPKYLGWFKRAKLFAFRAIPPSMSQFLIPLVARELRGQTARVILPGEPSLLAGHIQKRTADGVRLNLNHLGEAILSEEEAKYRIQVYLNDLQNPQIDYVSVKISTIFSQISLLAWDDSVNTIVERLKPLYRASIKNSKEPKFINLDMEEYRDLHLTIAAFKKILDEPEFFHYSAGIVLQAYLPDAHACQIELTEWAKERVKNGGGWIKIRIVKGANLSMEQFEASLRGWAQAPYCSKTEVDANYKRMVIYGCIPENARAVRLGIASHNLFDIAFAMLLRSENRVEVYTGFEMLEGMADHIRRVVQKLTGSMLLYCPVATKQEFQHAIAYLIRRLDENTGSENFLRHVFGLRPGSENWENQAALFFQSCDEIETAPVGPRRKQNRQVPPPAVDPNAPFDNEPDTDFSLSQNQRWAETLAHVWKAPKIDPLPLVIGGEELYDNEEGIGFSPNDPKAVLFRYAKADKKHIVAALEAAKRYEPEWAATSTQHRSHLLARVAHKLRERRGELIGAMLADGGKAIAEADPEVSEAIDFAEYYRRQLERMTALKDISWTPKGTILVVSPWNFPCAIPIGGMVAALAAGNCVLFKPSSNAVLAGFVAIKALWDAGIPKEALQFIPCSGGDVGSQLIADPRLNGVVLTGGTDTAKKFLKLQPSLDLAAETGGKNSMIVSALSDRDLVVKDLLQSAFGHSGQKCSAVSLAILEAEVYDDPRFLAHLRNAAKSLKVGPSWDLSAKITPLITTPSGPLLRGLTTLEPGESWLLEPKQDARLSTLWSPGIKLGVRPGSFTHMTELFGPVLGLMRAENLEHALYLANAVPYGLTAGFHGLDEREQTHWIENIEAGNLYVNRTTTGAIVRRQPFGGTKASSFGHGSKAGGPNYLREFVNGSQIGLPQEKAPINEAVNFLTSLLENVDLTAEQLGLWTASVANYAYWWRRLKQDRDPTKIVGQDNLFRYVPRQRVVLRFGKRSSALDALRSVAAAVTVGAGVEISTDLHDETGGAFHWASLHQVVRVVEESEASFLQRVRQGACQRVRLVEHPSAALCEAAASHPVLLIDAPVLANGRFELLHYLREVAISIDYHRYGTLGMREGELRKPIF